MKHAIRFFLLVLTIWMITGCDTLYTDIINKKSIILPPPPFKGDAAWARSVTAGAKSSRFISVAVAKDGIYAAGYIDGAGAYWFGDQSVNGAAVENTVLVKYQ